MGWSGSAVFRDFFFDRLTGASNYDLDNDTLKIALYDNDITPDKDATLIGYNEAASQWVSSGNEVFDGANWAVGGVALSSVTVTKPTSGVVMLDADNTDSSTSNATLANVHGGLIYDDTVAADPGICYLYFGGPQTVTAGLFRVQYHSNGIFRVTV